MNIFIFVDFGQVYVIFWQQPLSDSQNYEYRENLQRFDLRMVFSVVEFSRKIRY